MNFNIRAGETLPSAVQRIGGYPERRSARGGVYPFTHYFIKAGVLLMSTTWPTLNLFLIIRTSVRSFTLKVNYSPISVECLVSMTFLQGGVWEGLRSSLHQIDSRRRMNIDDNGYCALAHTHGFNGVWWIVRRPWTAQAKELITQSGVLENG